MTNTSSSQQGFSCPLPITCFDRIVMAHGAGGSVSHDLIQGVFAKIFDDDEIRAANDFAAIEPPSANMKLVVSTDAHVVSPIFFPGGDIGRLAVCGTVNDISVSGAVPICITASFILEEGLPIKDIVTVSESMKKAAVEAGIRIVAGDTKVVEKGKADKIFISTSGVGYLLAQFDIRGNKAKPGDSIILSGPIGDHGIAILLARGGLNINSKIVSDVSPLNKMVQSLLKAAPSVHVLRDPTRGGVATVLNEIACQSGVNIQIDENSIPVSQTVHSVCDLLGFDPLYLANEGKLIAVVPETEMDDALNALRNDPYGQEAVVIGKILDYVKNPVVTMRTQIGAIRIVDMLSGEMLPRIC